MAKKKYYVVWEGRSCGVFDNWADCEQQIKGFNYPKYKAFETQTAAIEAYRNGYSNYINNTSPKEVGISNFASTNAPIYPSIAVDAACSGVPGPMEYQGVITQTGERIFHFGPVPDGTNNIGEFLALVHALALLKKNGCNDPIYSDSVTAIAWVRRKKANTHMIQTGKNAILFDLIKRAEKWLSENTFKNPIFKWETSKWGEIPADFGRK